jgi:hypothetical protein
MPAEPLHTYHIKNHAHFEMKRRQISEEHGTGKEYLFRVVIDTQYSPPEVVTVYKTSKITKYWR